MSEKPPSPVLPPLIDNGSAPEFFTIGATGFGFLEGNIVITFETMRFDHNDPPPPPTRLVAGRVVMPIPAVQRLVLGLYDFLKQRGLDPEAIVKATPDETAQ